jgi:hypothetical protein
MGVDWHFMSLAHDHKIALESTWVDHIPWGSIVVPFDSWTPVAEGISEADFTQGITGTICSMCQSWLHNAVLTTEGIVQIRMETSMHAVCIPAVERALCASIARYGVPENQQMVSIGSPLVQGAKSNGKMLPAESTSDANAAMLFGTITFEAGWSQQWKSTKTHKGLLEVAVNAVSGSSDQNALPALSFAIRIGKNATSARAHVWERNYDEGTPNMVCDVTVTSTDAPGSQLVSFPVSRLYTGATIPVQLQSVDRVEIDLLPILQLVRVALLSWDKFSHLQ